MKFHIFRNSTIEPLFSGFDVSFSGYGDISSINSLADRYIWFYTVPYKHDETRTTDEIISYLDSLDYLLRQSIEGKQVIALTLTDMVGLVYELANNRIKEAISKYNQCLRDKSMEFPNLKVVDLNQFTSRFAIDQLVDWKYYYLSMMPLNPKLAKDFGLWFRDQMSAIDLHRKKCVILDLDNTLWGGIIGEDGLNGIKIGGTYPGNAFTAFQEGLLELTRKGIVLAICSKNNESDVAAVWGIQGMVLKKEHFAAFRINWKDKATNTREIAEELNLGLDSFLFIDDNPSERELIKGMLPMVEVPEFPLQPYELPRFFKFLVEKYFLIYKVTDEDLQKTKQYRENVLRTELKASFNNFSDYIKNLEIVISIIRAGELNLSRLAQMSWKTNQFNLTTKRYSEEDLRSFLKKGSWIYCISVRDRFGDNGITGMIIVHPDGSNTAVIDSLLMSCRILGRKIEDQFLQHIVNRLFSSNIIEIKACFIPTKKNEQVSDFYEDHGFTLLGTEAEGTKTYVLKREDFVFTINKNYVIDEL